jgi:hypothetical protein
VRASTVVRRGTDVWLGTLQQIKRWRERRAAVRLLLGTLSARRLGRRDAAGWTITEAGAMGTSVAEPFLVDLHRRPVATLPGSAVAPRGRARAKAFELNQQHQEFTTRTRGHRPGAGIVYRCIATHLVKTAGFSRKTAQTGAVTLIQRFGSALNLNVHFHMLFLDGVYVERPDGSLSFRWVKAPTSELTQLTQNLARRIGRYLEHQGLLERDAENSSGR